MGILRGSCAAIRVRAVRELQTGRPGKEARNEARAQGCSRNREFEEKTKCGAGRFTGMAGVLEYLFARA